MADPRSSRRALSLNRFARGLIASISVVAVFVIAFYAWGPRNSNWQKIEYDISGSVELPKSIENASDPILVKQIQKQLQFTVTALGRNKASFHFESFRVLRAAPTSESIWSYTAAITIVQADSESGQDFARTGLWVPLNPDQIQARHINSCYRFLRRPLENLGESYLYWLPMPDCSVRQTLLEFREKSSKDLQLASGHHLQQDQFQWKRAVILFSRSEPEKSREAEAGLLSLNLRVDSEVRSLMETANLDPGIKKFVAVANTLAESMNLSAGPIESEGESFSVELRSRDKEGRRIQIYVADDLDAAVASVADRVVQFEPELLYYSGHAFHGRRIEQIQQREWPNALRVVILSACYAFHHFNFNELPRDRLYVLNLDEGVDVDARAVIQTFLDGVDGNRGEAEFLSQSGAVVRLRAF